ncbi:DUF2599 domain-containing protein [Nocardia sp. NPDC024068]|uniref:DUF2599 domain-containing protein n=1 Tax=Nocardia sp. NPDC024068 TaxID=3157197 RepID=UPI003404FD32
MPTRPTVRLGGIFAVVAAVATGGCANPDPEPGTDPATTAGTPSPSSSPAIGAAATRTPIPTVDPYAGMPLIERLEWTSNADGTRLMVHPTRAGRDTTFPGSDARAWQEVVRSDPAADTPGMWNQFRCHWDWARLIAPEKPSWNLEPWRPPVGYDATVDAACNPGGPER